MLEARSSRAICRNTCCRCAHGHQQSGCPGGSCCGGARCGTGGSSELGDAVSGTWPGGTTERHDCIALQPAAPWVWRSSRGRPSKPSSERGGQALAGAYRHQDNFLKRERASNSGTNGNKYWILLVYIYIYLESIWRKKKKKCFVFFYMTFNQIEVFWLLLVWTAVHLYINSDIQVREPEESK